MWQGDFLEMQTLYSRVIPEMSQHISPCGFLVLLLQLHLLHFSLLLRWSGWTTSHGVLRLESPASPSLECCAEVVEVLLVPEDLLRLEVGNRAPVA